MTKKSQTRDEIIQSKFPYSVSVDRKQYSIQEMKRWLKEHKMKSYQMKGDFAHYAVESRWKRVRFKDQKDAFKFNLRFKS